MAAEDDQSRKISLKRGLGPAPENPVCDSGIFCYGPLLEAVQMARIYADSKTFVDQKLKFPPGKIIKNFEKLLSQHDGSLLSVDQIKKFVEEHFDPEGLELEPWVPEDWTPEPEFIANLRKPALRNLAKRIAKLWKDLSRKIKEDVKDHANLYSIIYVPNGFIVPGGRFREFYYWDTYWIIKALLHYDMSNTVKGIIENFLIMVKTYGLVPNGGRIYYTKRSQPPYLTLMMKEYIDKTADVQFLRTQLPTLTRELDFWEDRRSVEVEKNGKSYTLFIFGTGGTGPRPESYREDVEFAESFETEAEREDFYYHMKAGAESGWDYSTRWFINKNGGNNGSLMDVKTSHILPVDLNALMYMNYMAVAEFYSLLGDSVKSDEYIKKASNLKEAIAAILWHEDEQMWYDYDLHNDKARKYFYPSNLFPLWADCYDTQLRDQMAKSAVEYLRKTGAIRCKGGVPTSLDESGQQWDFPNAWPPLQHILVAGLLKTENVEARGMALTIARRYTNGAIFSCPDGAEVCNMFEKYNVNEQGHAGGGGEYDVQTGFGWTNGVVIDFMVLFGDDLLSDEEDEELKEGKKAIEVELNTHFDTSRGKSKLVKRDSNITVVIQPEKHELEQSEKCIHPALAIEEDDLSEEFKSKSDLVRKISGINGDVTISDALTTISSDTKKTTPLTDLIEEDEEDGEEVKTIAGKGIKDANDSDDLILHLVSTSLSNIHEKPKGEQKSASDETIEVHLNQDDVHVTLTDEKGNPLPIKDVDLQLKLPSKCKDTSFKGTLKQFVKKLKKSEDITYTVKERVKLTDHATGQSFDVEMNLKVKLPNANSNKNTVKKSNSFPFVESIKRSVLCPSMPWRCRGGDPEDSPRKSSEVGQKIFKIAAAETPSPVITKSPKKREEFTDLSQTNNNTET